MVVVKIHQFLILSKKKESYDEEKTVGYLEKGVVLIPCGEVVADIVEPNNGFAGCPDIMTDGIWLWPGDLPYYVRKYHLLLNPEFIKLCKKQLENY